MADLLDLVTWPQFRAAFQIAALALTEIEGAAQDPQIVAVATDALRAMQAEVSRFDISEPSWEPHTFDLRRHRRHGTAPHRPCRGNRDGAGRWAQPSRGFSPDATPMTA